MRTFLTFIFIFLSLPLFAQNSTLRQGNKAYDEGKFGKAFELYEKASEKAPSEASYNSGTALYRLQDYGAASSAFENALVPAPKNKQEASLNQNALYNLGNSAYKAGDKEGAKQAMRAAILLNLKDKDAKQNLQFMLKEENAQKQSQQQKQNPQKDQDNKQDKQQNQDKQNQNKQKQDQKQQEQEKQEQKEKETSAKEEAASVLQMAQEHKQDLPKQEQRSNQIEKDW